MKTVHEYSVDRATSTARIGATNPIRKYIRGQVDEVPPVVVQLAHGELHFYDQGGAPLEMGDVPEDVLESLRVAPLRRGTESVEQVIWTCPFCPSNDNVVASGEKEQHLIDHVKRAATSATRIEPVAETIAEPPAARAKGRFTKKAK